MEDRRHRWRGDADLHRGDQLGLRWVGSVASDDRVEPGAESGDRSTMTSSVAIDPRHLDRLASGSTTPPRQPPVRPPAVVVFDPSVLRGTTRLRVRVQVRHCRPGRCGATRTGRAADRRTACRARSLLRPGRRARRSPTAGGQLGTDLGCSDDLSAAGSQSLLGNRLGPVLGWDYQHVYPLGGDRFLCGCSRMPSSTIRARSTTSEAARFVHNAAMLQEGRCFRLLHRGTADRPDAFETRGRQGRSSATDGSGRWVASWSAGSCGCSGSR